MFNKKLFITTRQTLQFITLTCLALYGLIMLTEQSLELWHTKSVAAQEAAVEIRASAVSIPFVMSYQGELYDDSGNPLNGRYNISFKLYDDTVSTNARWTERHNGVAVQAGHFSVQLGSLKTLPETLFTDDKLPYIGVTVHPNAEMTPRQRFNIVPFALYAKYAELATNATNAVSAVNAESANKLNGQISGSQIQNKSIELNKLNFTDSNGNISFGDAMAFKDGTLNIQGDITYQAIKQIGFGQPTTYPVTTRRYHVEATKDQVDNSIPLDMEIVNELCQDEDGCMVTLGMRNYASNISPGIVASNGPYRLFLSETSDHWRSSAETIGVDGNGRVEHIIRSWDCYFTDGEYTNRRGSDNKKSQLNLLNFNNEYRDPNMVCALTIDD